AYESTQDCGTESVRRCQIPMASFYRRGDNMLRLSSTRHAYLLLGILFLIAAPLRVQNKVTTKDCPLATEDYAVYSAVFRSRENSIDPPSELVIVDETVTTREAPERTGGNFQIN